MAFLFFSQRLVVVVVTLIVVKLSTCAVSTREINVTRFDCGMRQLAFEFSHKIQPWRSHEEFQHVYDALRLSDLCGLPAIATEWKSSSTSVSASSAATALMEQATATATKQEATAIQQIHLLADLCDASTSRCLHVVSSEDATGHLRSLQNGSESHPFHSIHDAMEYSRRLQSIQKRIIILHEGIHQLQTTLTLTDMDAGLEIRGYPGEEVWISGGRSLKSVEWTPWKNNKQSPNTVLVANLTRLLRDDKTLPPLLSLFSTTPHARLIRARYPNSNPEVDQWGYASFHRLTYSLPSNLVVEWRKPPKGTPPAFTYYNLTGLGKNDSTMEDYNVYASGAGGVCANVWSGDSYWCSNASAGGWAEVDKEAAMSGQLQIPVGMTYNQSTDIGQRLSRWGQSALGGIVHAWHSQSWAMHMFEISSQLPGYFGFSKGGGQQGGRNWCRCDQCTYAGGWCRQHEDPPDHSDDRLISGSWMVENVLAELDQPGEYYFDPGTKLLYVIPNTTDDISSLGLRIAVLETLIDVRNTSKITISNIGFRDTAATYMSDWGVPSGGDWALHRGGALLLENVEKVLVHNCRFRRLDGNAVFLSRKTRNVTISRNIFEWIGENAVAFWGDTEDYDATSGNQPHGTWVIENIMRELGIFQKQSSAIAHNKAASSKIGGNIMFNMPRAAINFNDMMGGGDIVEGNLIFNTCRETGDHGPINTWDRQPFLTTLRTGEPSFVPIPRVIYYNLIFANYGASQAVDNDDGSSFYHISTNVFHHAEGFKMDYGGHDSQFVDNLVLAYPYDGQNCVSMGADFIKGHGHSVYGNKCIFGITPYNIGSGCGDPSCRSPEKVSPEDLEVVVSLFGSCDDTNAVLNGNSYYTPNGTAVFRCGDERYSLEELQSKYGLEMGSTYASIPSEDTMIGWAQDMLFGDDAPVVDYS